MSTLKHGPLEWFINFALSSSNKLQGKIAVKWELCQIFYPTIYAITNSVSGANLSLFEFQIHAIQYLFANFFENDHLVIALCKLSQKSPYLEYTFSNIALIFQINQEIAKVDNTLIASAQRSSYCKRFQKSYSAFHSTYQLIQQF